MRNPFISFALAFIASPLIASGATSKPTADTKEGPGTDATTSDTLHNRDTTLPTTTDSNDTVGLRPFDSSTEATGVTTTDKMSSPAEAEHQIANSDDLVLDFKKGSSQLSAEQKSSLSNFLKSFKNTTGLDSVVLAAWADKSSSSKSGTSAQNKKLAEARAIAIKTFITTECDFSNVESFNMTDKTNWLARSINSAPGEARSIYSRTDTFMTADEIQLVKQDGKLGSVVVVAMKKADLDEYPAKEK